MNNIHWSGIRSFIAVAEHGSFTAAAEALGMSKASLSQQVTALEKTLGVQLLYRTTRILRLTEIGQGYYEQCRAGVNQLDNAREWATQSTQALSGTIHMNSVGGLIGEELIAPMLIEFQQTYPQIDVSLDFSSQRVDLIESQYDLVMRMGELPDSSLIARRLHVITTRYVASPEFLTKQGAIQHPNDLRELPLIYGSVSEWLFVKPDEQVRIQASRGFQIANGRVMCRAAEQGLGVARLADPYVNVALREGSLVEVLPEWRQTTPLSLICPPARYQLNRVRTLADWLIEHFPARYQPFA
ncbi:LysR substrate-binding domain-containing protein [Pontibacterium sp.]|uniref:LysR family transcriptional regulator n=1 Tax=Pontibacterium sp. TaxID=2036026 RepID=UPI0035687331